MRRVLAAVALAIMCGACARVRVTNADYEARQRTVCGNKFADAEDLDEAAFRACFGDAHKMRCGDVAYATTTQAFGGATSGFAVSRNVTGLCCRYQCE
jgi:hypothetical protein